MFDDKSARSDVPICGRAKCVVMDGKPDCRSTSGKPSIAESVTVQKYFERDVLGILDRLRSPR